MDRILKINRLFATNPIIGNFCQLHHVNIDDADLIYDLRTRRKDSYLKATYGTVEDQRKYLESYLKRFAAKEEIYYKIFDIREKKFLGLLRLTQLNDERIFNWQSFVVAETTSPNVALDAMLMIYRIGLEFLDLEFCGPWEVDKNFSKMFKIYDFMKIAKIIGENEKYYLLTAKKEDYQSNINKFLKMGFADLKGLI